MLNTISNFLADNGMTIVGYIVSFIGGTLIGYFTKGGDFYGENKD